MIAFLWLLSIVFWVWCGGLAVLAILCFASARSLREGDPANSAAVLVAGILSTVLLMASLLIRWCL